MSRLRLVSLNGRLFSHSWTALELLLSTSGCLFLLDRMSLLGFQGFGIHLWKNSETLFFSFRVSEVTFKDKYIGGFAQYSPVVQYVNVRDSFLGVVAASSLVEDTL